ncbi:MAG TPA: hemerythrin domain-containing protein [Bryobacteraceae bacterium]|nr:hemerythrin domain-containing protein [Bryobacteraceae bacterium]
MNQHNFNRRQAFLASAAVAMAGLPSAAQDEKKNKAKEPEVTATEDLMREHGVIRRALLVYHETVPLLRAKYASVDPAALYKTAQLFRRFGEDYHERMLEETHIFPMVRKLSGRAGKYPDVLEAQHRRGREITDYILGVTKGGRMDAAHAEPLAKAMEGLVHMYQHHAAREDTIVFPAWKNTMSAKQLDEISDKFEEIEHREFGKDGFEDAEKTVDGIEVRLGLSDISKFTPPTPPKL